MLSLRGLLAGVEADLVMPFRTSLLGLVHRPFKAQRECIRIENHRLGEEERKTDRAPEPIERKSIRLWLRKGEAEERGSPGGRNR